MAAKRQQMCSLEEYIHIEYTVCIFIQFLDLEVVVCVFV